jgi:hypothetical protein
VNHLDTEGFPGGKFMLGCPSQEKLSLRWLVSQANLTGNADRICDLANTTCMMARLGREYCCGGDHRRGSTRLLHVPGWLQIPGLREPVNGVLENARVKRRKSLRLRGRTY